MKKREMILQQYQSGKNCVEVANELNCSVDYAREVVRTAGISRSNPIMSDDNVSVIVSEKTNGRLTYLCGYSGSDCYVTVQCNKCGYVFDKSMISIRHGRSVCPKCFERQTKKETEQRKQAQQITKEKAKEVKRFYRKVSKYYQLSAKECIVCGALFVSSSSRQKTCSEECSKKAQNKRRDHRITKDKQLDNITLAKLIKRDKGVCWLCNKPIDETDYLMTSEGYFIVGRDYPSIDHVKPIAHGGTDSWDNVRLAHHRCNSLRRDMTNMELVRLKIKSDSPLG